MYVNLSHIHLYLEKNNGVDVVQGQTVKVCRQVYNTRTYSSLKVTQILSKELIFKINDSFENALTNTSAIFHLVPFVT